MLNVDIISATFAVCYFVECFVPLSHSQTNFLFELVQENERYCVRMLRVCVCLCFEIIFTRIQIDYVCSLVQCAAIMT